MRHRFINNFIIVKTQTSGKWQSVISEICFVTSQRSAHSSASDLFEARSANISSAAIYTRGTNSHTRRSVYDLTLQLDTIV